jgi:hypothetical protein
VPTIAFALLLTLAGRSTGHAILHVDIAIDRGTVSQYAIDTAIEEAAAIWSPYGVDVRAAACSNPSTDAIRLMVRVIGSRTAGVGPGSIGSIEFVHDTPRPNVRLFADDAWSMIEESAGEGVRAWSPAYHDQIEGRTLGRALAHELGHYLLRMRGHSGSGLMRAHHSMLSFIEHDRHPFRLSSADASRLAVLIAARVEPSARVTAYVTGYGGSYRSNR